MYENMGSMVPVKISKLLYTAIQGSTYFYLRSFNLKLKNNKL